MKRKVLFQVLFLGLIVLVFNSCDQNLGGQDYKNNELVTPYSNMDDLQVARSVTYENSDLVDWKVARFFAVLEKIDFESMYPWHGAKVSQYPVVIYHVDSNTPPPATMSLGLSKTG